MLKKLIFASLCLLAVKLGLNLGLIHAFVHRPDWMSVTLQWLLLIIVVLQIGGIYFSKMKWLWYVSLAQCALIYFTSEGTFGWFFTYMLKPFETYRPYPIYFVSLSLVAAELAKTLWLYFSRNDVSNLKLN
jgi:hypothetical protein